MNVSYAKNCRTENVIYQSTVKNVDDSTGLILEQYKGPVNNSFIIINHPTKIDITWIDLYTLNIQGSLKIRTAESVNLIGES